LVHQSGRRSPLEQAGDVYDVEDVMDTDQSATATATAAAILAKFQALRASGLTGFTLGVNAEEHPPEAGGYAVGTQRFDTPEAAIAAMISRPQRDLFLGWWRSEDGVEHIDLVRIFPADARWAAVLAGLFGGEAAVYDFARDELIHLYADRKGKEHAKECRD